MNRAGMLAVCVVMVALPAGCGQKAPPGAGPDAAASAIPPDKELGIFEPVPGTAFLVAPIVDVRDQGRGSFADSFSSSSYAGERGLPRNYVFLDPVHETFQRLMSWNGWRILGKTGFPPQNPHGMPGEPTEWFVYEIVKADTNGDGHWNYGDELTIAVSDAAGRDFTEVLSKVERVHSTSRRDPSTLLVVYRSQAHAWIARVDMKTRKVVNTTELPSFGPDVR